MSCFVNSNTGCSDTPRRIDTKAVVKVVLCLILYAVFGCVISDENELHNKRTNEIPYIVFEYGDYIFVLASAVWLSVNYESGIKSHNILKFMHELWICVIFTNIALKVVWTQLIEFTSIFCTHLSEWLAKLHSYVGLDFIQKASEMVKSETCGRILLTAIALLMFYFVLQTVNLIGFIQCLIMKAKCPDVDCSSPERRTSLRVSTRRNTKGVPRRRRRTSPRLPDEFDDDYDSQYVEPVNGPILSEF